ncbi:unnamed protein product [Prunus armeniaca]
MADAGIATRGVTKIVAATETVGGERQLALLTAVSRDEIMVVDRFLGLNNRLYELKTRGNPHE